MTATGHLTLAAVIKIKIYKKSFCSKVNRGSVEARILVLVIRSTPTETLHYLFIYFKRLSYLTKMPVYRVTLYNIDKIYEQRRSRTDYADPRVLYILAIWSGPLLSTSKISPFGHWTTNCYNSTAMETPTDLLEINYFFLFFNLLPPCIY